MPTDRTQPKKKTNKDILNQLLNPLQENVLKTVQKVQKEQVEEAMSMGVPPEHILQQLGLNVETPQINVGSVDKTRKMKVSPQKGILGKLFGQSSVMTDESGTPTGVQQGGVFDLQRPSTNNLIEQLLGLSKVSQAPLEMQAEQRRQKSEERLQKQYELNKKAQYGGIVTSQDLEEDPNLSATIEAYGIPAQVNPQTGERTWALPDRYRQRALASQQMPTPAEEQFFNDTFDAIDTTKEVLIGLDELGIKDPSQFGTIIPETIMSELGPLSIPAKFNLAGQYAKDPKYTAMKAKLERVFQKYRKIVTGAQASYTELKMLRPLIASFTQRPGVFYAVANDMISEGERMVGSRLDLMESVGRDAKKLRGLVEKRTGQKGSQGQKSSFKVVGVK